MEDPTDEESQIWPCYGTALLSSGLTPNPTHTVFNRVQSRNMINLYYIIIYYIFLMTPYEEFESLTSCNIRLAVLLFSHIFTGEGTLGHVGSMA